jgi:hypothetical protein
MAKLQSGTVVYGNLTVNTFANIAGNLILGAQLFAGGSYGTNGQVLQNVGGTGVAWANPGAGSSIFNGTSNVAVLSTGGNVVISVGGAIIANIGSSGMTIIGGLSAGTITVNGSIKGTITSGTAVASTSGTSITFTGIPSWAKRVTVMLAGVSTSGSSDLLLRVGSGSVSTSGYAGFAQTYWSGASQGSTNSTGALFQSTGLTYAAATTYTTFTLFLVNPSTNLWSMTGTTTSTGGLVTFGSISSFTNTLSGALDRVSITTVNGTDTFDAGSINILYEG